MKRRSVVLLAGVGLSAAIGGFYWLKDKDSLVRQNGYKGSALPDAWDSSADVIVVGGGAAGLSAALSASESGASVILIEQNDALGGDTLISGGYFNAVDPSRQAPMGIRDSVQLFKKQIIESGGGKNSPQVAEVFAKEASVSLAWLERHGMRFLPDIFNVFGSPSPRAHKPVFPRGEGYIRTLSSACLKKKVDIQLKSRATGLFRNDQGRIIGIEIIQKEGLKSLRASKGVILASGGYGANKEMLERFAPRFATLPCDSQSGATGEMIHAAAEIGAPLQNMDLVECTPGSLPGSDLMVRLDIRPNRMIMVDLEGKRFVDESGYRSKIAEAILSLPEQHCWSISDSDTVSSFDVTIQKNLYRNLFAGHIFRADTLEKLAQQIQVPPASLRSSVLSVSQSRHIKTPPFWAAPVYLRIHTTLGGLVINGKAECVDSNGVPIPGLWAAGEAVGNVQGANRLGGNGINNAVTFGRLAGAGVAKM